MKKTFIGLSLEKSFTELFSLKGLVLFLMCFLVVSAPVNTFAQQPSKTVSGTVIEASGAPMLGVTVLVKGTTIGTITDLNGNFTLSVPDDARTLVFSFVGMASQEIAIGNQTRFNITLVESTIGIGEVVVVGYGSQKKESVVGAIVQTTSTELQRTGGVMNLAQALTGQLSGVTTIQGSGLPGQDDPRIIIRAQGTWNNSNPLILIDGIERRMNDIDISEVETISVLKDASATAVFGVKGSEGVILITTKRGKIGKPKITFDANASGKMISRTPDKLGSYDQFIYRNSAIEREVALSETSWGLMVPMEIARRYNPAYQTDPMDPYIFPSVDWPKEMVKPIAWSQRINWNIAGGTEFAKYFASVSYTYDADLLKSGMKDNERPYQGNWHMTVSITVPTLTLT
jgi:TonB-linked SusC/RagA family outer membrane protein